MNTRTIKNRRYASLLIIIAGAALLAYGAAYHYIEVYPKDAPTQPPQAPPEAIENTDSTPQILSLPETDVILDTTRGGIKHLETGILQRTYGGDEKPDDYCPT